MTVHSVLPFRSIEHINAAAPVDPELIAQVMFLWDQKLDTHQMAKCLFPGMKDGEAVVWRALIAGREQRRRERG